MGSYFFRVEHDLLRSEVFKTLGGSAIKVYLVIGLYSDFGSDWAYPSIRTIARQAGLSRQTVMVAIEELLRAGLLAASKSPGRSTAYRILRQPPPVQQRPRRGHGTSSQAPAKGSHPETLDVMASSGPNFLGECLESGRETFEELSQFFTPDGQKPRLEQESSSREDTTTIPIPGTPFRMTAEGRLLVAVDLQELLANQGIPRGLARRLIAQRDPEAVAKVLLNAFYLKSQGKLQNGPGYIRAGIEDGYDLLPQIASKLETRRQQLMRQLRQTRTPASTGPGERSEGVDEAAIAYVIEQLGAEELERLIERAVAALPEPLVRHNRTLSNPFVRGKVYQLAAGEPLD